MQTPSPVPESPSSTTSRRDFLKSTTAVVGVSALSGVRLPHVHAAGDSTLGVALIGCGGRGSGAAVNALTTAKAGPIRLTAMADVFKNRLDGSYEALKKNGDVAARVEVSDDRKFVGFDAYKHAMDALKPGDIAIFATPLAFR